MVSSPLVADSNPPAGLRGERCDSPRMRLYYRDWVHLPKKCGWLQHCDGLGESNCPFLAGASGPIEEATLKAHVLPDAIPIRRPILLVIRRRYPTLLSGERNSSGAHQFVLLKRSQFPLIPCHSSDCLKPEEHAPKSNNPNIERRGKPNGVMVFSPANERRNWRAISLRIRRLSGA